MASLRPVGRSAATLDKDRVSLCRFTFADGRQCRTPRAARHPHSPLLFTCSGKNPHQTTPALTHLNATLTNHPTSVDSKQLTTNLNPPESTLTKNMGGRGGVMVNQISDKEICPEEHRDEGPLLNPMGNRVVGQFPPMQLARI